MLRSAQIGLLIIATCGTIARQGRVPTRPNLEEHRTPRARHFAKFPLLALLAISLTGCGDTISGKRLAEPEVQRFHELLQHREFEAMYAGTAERFKAVVPKKTAIALFGAVDRKLGPLRETKQVNWQVNTHNLLTTVVLVYQSRFEGGEATETFTFHVQSGKPELIGYNIASIDMLIK